MLYERNYNLGLTEEEKSQYKKLTEDKEKCDHRRFRKAIGQSNLPKAARMYNTLFPNNYLDIVDLQDKEKINLLNEEFVSLIDDKSTTEKDILKFIRENRSYHISASIINGCNISTGHHGTFLFKEFQLGNKYQPDYLLCGRSSGGYEFIFIELENPNGRIIKKDGKLGYEFNDGISQLEDWKRWLHSNYSNFSDTLKKYKNPEKELPDEFYSYDPSRMHYVVVAGRRKDFKDITYIIKREKLKSDYINILHYDNLIDFADLLIEKITY